MILCVCVACKRCQSGNMVDILKLVCQFPSLYITRPLRTAWQHCAINRVVCLAASPIKKYIIASYCTFYGILQHIFFVILHTNTHLSDLQMSIFWLNFLSFFYWSNGYYMFGIKCIL
uniref:Uncharacterized protein n=1 Tax=Cacopsylla melanoneura TaxID=428564 RepID=A0A8D8ZDB8_9HEMI